MTLESALESTFTTRGPVSWRRVFPAAAGLLILHWFSLHMPAYPAAMVNDTLLAGMPVLAIFLLYRRMPDLRPSLRLNAWLFAFGLAFWAVGMVLFSISDVTRRPEPHYETLAILSDFIYGVPALLAVTLTLEDRGEASGFDVFVLLDMLQVGLAALLAYVHAFDGPFSAHPFQSIPVPRLIHYYNLENLVLALVALLRAVTFPRGSLKRTFFGLVAGFLWLYASCAALYNYFEMQTPITNLWHNVIVDLPWIALCSGLLVLCFPEERQPVVSAPSGRRHAIFLENSIAILFCLVVLGLGSSLMQRHFPFGFGAVALALMLYGARAAVQQSHYVRAQQKLAEARDRLEALSLEDALTRVANRRRFDQVLEESVARSRRTESPLSLLMLDIDHFKLLNDHYGHRVGDACLVRIAHAIQLSLNRVGDLPARYGGEEFAVVLPDTTDLGAQQVASRIRAAVRSLDIRYEEGKSRCVTVSIGVATCDMPGFIRPSEMVEAADQALYLAKQNGRDRVEVAEMALLDGAAWR
ncbi:GGDEF domain-containing protein [Silvibacterium sp.]|uniref:GGDEF domain-containing protein n=1 Tax=Silvibacterium sp. TaxID=1964179 RepID=UPI0039E62259